MNELQTAGKDLKPIRLTLKQQDFISYYLNPDDIGTYGNATKSAGKAYKCKNLLTASSVGCELLTSPKIQAAISQIQADKSTGLKVRTDQLGRIIQGSYIQQTVKTTKAGKTVTRREHTQRTPSPAEITRAAHVLSKIDGTYNTNEIKQDVMTQRLKDLFKTARSQDTPADRDRGGGEAGGPPVYKIVPSSTIPKIIKDGLAETIIEPPVDTPEKVAEAPMSDVDAELGF